MMRLIADTSRCVGAGQCVRTNPTIFDQDDEDGTVRLLRDDVPDAAMAGVREAIDICPSGALSLDA